MNKLKIENTVFCEHVRLEVGGKHALLGVFAPELNILELPVTVPLVVWVSGTPTGVGSFAGEFRALAPDKSPLIGARFDGEFVGLSKTSIVIGPFPMPFTAAGDYTFEWNFGDRWEKISELRIHHTPNAVTAARNAANAAPPTVVKRFI